MDSAQLTIDLPLEHLASGKVREVFAVDQEHLLFVASDRLSAFDVIMNNGVPGKGIILTQMAIFWFEQLAHLGPHHLVAYDVADFPKNLQAHAAVLRGRSMLVKRCEIIPIEAIVRGYLAGSGWKEYQAKQTICDIHLPAGLVESSKLPESIFTPSTKAAIGDHDQNISPERAAEIVGQELAETLAKRSLETYQAAHDHAEQRGIILADTKFEFGLNNGDLVLADEVLTPDSSRFWPADDYEAGRSQASYDKQYVRNWLESIDFDKQSAITLPDDVVAGTQQRYVQAYEKLTGKALIV